MRGVVAKRLRKLAIRAGKVNRIKYKALKEQYKKGDKTL